MYEGRPITTRGRWVNPLVFALAKLTLSLPQLRTVNGPIFIVGMGRSGTTILGITLSLHSDVGFLNEPKALWYVANHKDDVIGNYSDIPGSYLLSESDAQPDSIRRIRRLYGGYLKLTRRQRVVDKYPEAVFRASYISECFPDCKFIVLIRDGLDTINSVAKWNSQFSKSDGHKKHDWWGIDDRKWISLVKQVACRLPAFRGKESLLMSLSTDIDRAALEWTLTTFYSLKCLKAFPDRALFLKYEKLTEQPRETIEQVLEFCELQKQIEPVAFAERKLQRRNPDECDYIEISPIVRGVFQEAYELAGYKSERSNRDF
ncbi:sulfotransferase [Candidatus Bathyarchaeota archaeon]|nr:sulfotransferase [Candidatus Bathyarchaeota archaeon]